MAAARCIVGRCLGYGRQQMVRVYQQKRCFTSITRGVSGIAITKDQSREFMAVFPDIIRELNEGDKLLEVPQASRCLVEMLQYNVPVGKKNRGLALLISYKMLEEPVRLTQENVRRAIVMGWCLEMFQAFHLMINDIIHASDSRRGRVCWYKLENVGLRAINDAIILQSAMYAVLKKHFENQPYYDKIIDSFAKMRTNTATGQYLDLDISNDLTKFTMKNYNSIVKHKTAYYTFQMPVVLAMLLSGIQDPEMYRQANTILQEMGLFFQMQDDYLNCFGDPSVTKMDGNDIIRGKCSWLAVVALQRANSEQKKVMEKYYGTGDVADADKIKQLYEEIGLRNTYAAYERDSYNTIKTHIQQISRGLPHTLFINIMDNIYGRKS